MAKRKSTQWSKAELKDIVKIVRINGTIEGYKLLAVKYGVTVNAIACRYKRCMKGESMTRTKDGSTKVPFIKKPRGHYAKKNKPLGDPTVLAKHTIPVVKSQAKNEMAFDIKDFRIDLKTKKLIIIF